MYSYLDKHFRLNSANHSQLSGKMRDLLSLTVTVDIWNHTNEAYAQRSSRITNVSLRNVGVSMSFQFVDVCQQPIEEDLKKGTEESN